MIINRKGYKSFYRLGKPFKNESPMAPIMFLWYIIKSRSFQLQKQLYRGVLRKRCSENMQQIYKRTPVKKRAFNKVVFQLNEIALWHGCSPVILQYIFRTLFQRTPLKGCFCNYVLHFGNNLFSQIVKKLKHTESFCIVVTLIKINTKIFKHKQIEIKLHHSYWNTHH